MRASLRVGRASARPRKQSDVEAFAAAALVLDVRIVEAKAFVQSLAIEVELRAVEVGQALGIDYHFHTVGFEHVVLGLDPVGVLELVGEPGATRSLDPEAQAHAFPALREKV